MAKLKAKTLDDAKAIFAAEKVRDMLKKKEISKDQFDMETFESKTSCGTVHCIGGWMYKILFPDKKYISNPTDDLNNLSDDLYDKLSLLFYPKLMNHHKLEPKHAIQAINNFLDGKKDGWRGVKV